MIELSPPPTRETTFYQAWWRWLSLTLYEYVKSLVTNENPNWIINGNFDRWDYGTNQTTNGYNSANDWRSSAAGGSTFTVSRSTFSPGQTDVPGNHKYYYSKTFTSGGSANSHIQTLKLLEGVASIQGIKTLEVWAYAPTAIDMSIEFRQSFGTGGSPSTTITGDDATFLNSGVHKVSLSTGWNKFQVTVNIPSVSGKTLGLNGDDFFAVVFWHDAGSDYDSQTDTLGNQSGTVHIARCGFVDGSKYTGFNNIHPLGYTIGRYYENSYSTGIYPGAVDSTGVSFRRVGSSASVRHFADIMFKTVKRSVPTVTVYSPTTGAPGNMNINNTDYAAAAALIGTDKAIAQVNTAFAAGDNHPLNIHWEARAEIA